MAAAASGGGTYITLASAPVASLAYTKKSWHNFTENHWLFI